MDADGVALVVGAGSGIGLETALTFAERGARCVAFADQNLDAVEEAVKQSEAIATADGFKALAIEVDVASREDVRSMVAETVSNFGRIDYVVHTAGIDNEELELLHDVNCRGVLYCLQEVIKIMKSQEERFVEGRGGRRSIGRGSITVITSLSALLGAPKTATYVASKFAARGIVKVAALENSESRIRINELCPGFTSTPMLMNALEGDEKLKTMIDSSLPLGRTARPEEIAGVAHFLATPSASYIHGSTIVVDSGVSIAVVS